MMKNMLVSIIVPVYNVEKYLNKCLDSLCNQTYKNIELILVNDGSTDSSLSICEKFAERDQRVIIVDKKNEGVSVARNTGLELAKGGCVMFVDSDDWLSEDAVEYGVKLMEKHNADIFIGSLTRETTNSSVYESSFPQKEMLFDERDIDQLINLLFIQRSESSKTVQNICGPCCKLYARKMLDAVRFNREIFYAEDTLFVYQTFLKSKKIICSQKEIYHYLSNENSVVHSKINPLIVQNYLKLLAEFVRISDENHRNDKKAIVCFFTKACFFCTRKVMVIPEMTMVEKKNVLKDLYDMLWKQTTLCSILFNRFYSVRLKLGMVMVKMGFFIPFTYSGKYHLSRKRQF